MAVVCNIIFDPVFAVQLGCMTSFPNVLIRHFRTCGYVISERVDTLT